MSKSLPMNSKHVVTGESVWIQAVKTAILAIAEYVYVLDVCDEVSRFVVAGCAVVAGILAGLLRRWSVRLVWILLASVLLTGIGIWGAWGILNGQQSDLFFSVVASRSLYFGSLALGLTLFLRSLALRYQPVRILESAVAVGALVFVFFEHRNMNLQNPREFADWAYGSGLDPIELYRYMGCAAAVLAIGLWLGRAKISRVIYAYAVLLLLTLLFANFGVDGHIDNMVEDPLGVFSNDKDDNDQGNKDDNNKNNEDDGGNDGDDGDDGDDESDKNGGNGNDGDDESNKNSGGGGGSSSNAPSPNNPPVPVAIAVLYDEFEPADGIFHFRQNVLSQYDGNHLTDSAMDADVISSFPYTDRLNALAVQSSQLHQKISTSMFLLQDHTNPPQLAMGQSVFPIDNPDPKVFVSAYAVESLGLNVDVSRFVGRKSIPDDWSDEKRAHYTEIPDDPRYKALSDIIVRQLDPRFFGEDIAKAIVIKAWLEHAGYYTLKTKHIDPSDPTASFLFGSMRGYCVHFAHSAVYLLRSQGIAARVALGYAVDNQLRGSNSAVLIMGNMGHAWPEIYIDGVGWVTFDIFPENGDPQPNEFVDQSLESLFGELARNDKSGGRAETPIDEGYEIPWQLIWTILLALLAGAVIVIYTRKGVIILRGASVKSAHDLPWALRSVMEVWALYGQNPAPSESLEHFASTRGEATQTIVNDTLCSKLGGSVSDEEAAQAGKLVRQAWHDARSAAPVWRKILAILKP